MIWRRWAGRQPTGIDRACLAYFAEFGGRAQAVVQRGGLTRILDPDLSAELTNWLSEHQHGQGSPGKIMAMLVRAFARKAAPPLAYRGVPYLNIGHTGLDLPGHARWVHATRVRPIYYIHDLIPITHPQYCREGEPQRHARRIAAALKLGHRIITNSHDSARALENYAFEYGLPQPPVIVAPLGLSIEPVAGSGSSPMPVPYFLMVGTIEGRKNYAVVLHAWEQLAARWGNATPHLVLIGRRGWAADGVFTMLDRKGPLQQFVHERGQVGDGELANYLAHARALLFPSFVEGQGLPLAEALAAGTPVIASDLAVFRETVGDIPEYLGPDDLDGWVALIEDYTDLSSPRRLTQMIRIVEYSPPRWLDHFLAANRVIGDARL